jgi:flagellar basal body-associated protein FliL
MDRKETDKEARATKNTKNVWKYILGVGIVLMAIAFWGGFFNHKESFQEAETPSQGTQAPADTAAYDTTMDVHPDTIMKSVRGTQ